MQNIWKIFSKNTIVIVFNFQKHFLNFKILHSQMKDTLYPKDSRLIKLIEKLLSYQRHTKYLLLNYHPLEHT